MIKNEITNTEERQPRNKHVHGKQKLDTNYSE